MYLVDGQVTVHTHIHRRNGGMLAFHGTAVAVQTVDLVGTGVYFVRVEDQVARAGKSF